MNRLAVQTSLGGMSYDDLYDITRQFPIHCGWLNLQRGIYYNFDYYKLLAIF